MPGRLPNTLVLLLRRLMILSCTLMLITPVSGQCSTECTVWSHLPCQVKSGVCDIPRDRDSPVVGPVLNLDPSPLGGHLGVDNTPVYLNVSWEIPVQGYRHVTGFLVKLIDHRGELPPICYHLDMKNARWTNADGTKRIRMHFACVKATWNTKYWLTVLSLPNQKSTSPNVTVYQFQKPKVSFDLVASDWSTQVSLEGLEEKQQIRVQFTPASSSTGLKFSFTGYRVTLRNKQYPMETKEVNFNQSQSTPVVFNNICAPGTWRGKVEPLEMGGGICRTSRGIACENVGRTCQPCKVSSSSSLWFIPVRPCREVPIKPGTAHVSVQMISTVIGICIACLLSAVLVAVLIYYSKSCVKANSSSGTNSTTEQLKPVIRKRATHSVTKSKRVLILYEEDHPYHTDVVHHLACFLQQHCKCDVTYDQWDMEMLQKDCVAWLMKHLEVSDTILLIHSEGGFRKYEAKKAMQAYENGPSPKVGLFVPGVEMIINERFKGNNGYFKSSQYTVSTFMPYTPREFVIEDASPFVYNLMDDVHTLVRHIHGVKAEAVMKGISEKVTGDRFIELSSGTELIKVINKMQEYIRKNSNWFADTHHRTSKDINDDSGRGTLQERRYSAILSENSKLLTAAPLVERAPEEVLYEEDVAGVVVTAHDVVVPATPATPATPALVIPTIPTVEVHKDNCKAAEQRQLTRSNSKVAELRQSFESNLNTISDPRQDKVRSNSKLSVTRKSTDSFREETMDSVPEAGDSTPLCKSVSSSKASSRDAGLGTSTYTSSLASRSSQGSSAYDSVNVEEDENSTISTTRHSRKKSAGSFADYSAIVDSAFEIALCGQSTGEPES